MTRFTPYPLMLVVFGLLFAQLSCRKQVTDEITVYQNDFETLDFSGLSRANISVFDGNYMAGFFNKGGFTLNLTHLPLHNYIKVSFDLYIIDSWDGNKGGVDGPDFWGITVDDKPYFTTTFLTRPCSGDDCNAQSFPAAFPANNYPREGSLRGMHGGCILFPEPEGTTVYHITRLIPHTGDLLKIDFEDQCKQLDVATDMQFCDESWTMDNLTVKAVDVN